MTQTPLSGTGRATDSTVAPPPSVVATTTESGFLSERDDVPLLSSTFCHISGYYSSPKGHCRLYKAERLGKWYILKGLKTEYEDNPLYQSLLWKEFEVGYKLVHPHIAQTYGMEDVPDCCRRTPLSNPSANDVAGNRRNCDRHTPKTFRCYSKGITDAGDWLGGALSSPSSWLSWLSEHCF